jgi:hypothetical protein
MANSSSEDSSSHSSLDQISTHTYNERNDANSAEDEEEVKAKQLAHQENRNVIKMQVVVLCSLALCAMVLMVVSFVMASVEEEDRFRDEVSGGSNNEAFQLKSQTPKLTDCTTASRSRSSMDLPTRSFVYRRRTSTIFTIEWKS